MRIANNAGALRANNRIGDGHGDLRQFRQLVRDAKSDGNVTKSEHARIRRAFNQLEPGEKKAVRQGRDGHRDVKKFKGAVKAAFADGKITPQEKAKISQAFSHLEPKEQKQAIDRLAQNGHKRLAIALSRMA